MKGSGVVETYEQEKNEQEKVKREHFERETKENNVVWTRVFYGHNTMKNILAAMENKDLMSSRFLLRYLFRSMMAGFIIMIMYFFVYEIRTELIAELPMNAGLSKLIGGAAFGFSLVLIYYTNSELLTSNFMYLTVGYYYKKIKITKMLKIWSLCLLGNLLGVIVAAALFLSAAQLANDQLVETMMHTIEFKTSLTSWQIFVSAIFANFFINIAVISSMEFKEAFPKIFVLMFCVMIFGFMGYEHVVANMALFIAGLISRTHEMDLMGILNNFIFSFIGNYVGGGLVIGLFYAYLNDDRKYKAEEKKRKLS